MFKAGQVLQGDFANLKAAEFFPAISANYSVDEAALPERAAAARRPRRSGH